MKPWMPAVAGVVLLVCGFYAGRASVTGVEINRGDRSRTMVAGTAHATASITAHQPAGVKPPWCERWSTEAPSNREARDSSVTPRLPSRQDPQTAAWYRMMAEKGYVPMTIMVPK